MTTLTVKLPATMMLELEECTKQEHATKSEVVRNALTRYFHSSQGRKKPTCYDLARPFVGCVKDGPPDLASNKSYLKGFGRD